jgi:hypothetical protein
MPKDSNFEEKLDFILSKHIEQMTAEEYASVCNSVSCTDSIHSQAGPYEHANLFQSFLKDSAGQAEQWLRENAFSLQDFPSVVFALVGVLDQIES